MSGSKSPKFNIVLQEIIKKSLFTERQIEIILNQRDVDGTKFPITRGAYYRQVAQSRNKMRGLYYSIVLLRGLGVLLPDDVDVMSRLSEQISLIKEGDFFPEKGDEIIDVIDMVVKQACNM